MYIAINIITSITIEIIAYRRPLIGMCLVGVVVTINENKIKANIMFFEVFIFSRFFGFYSGI